MAERPAKPVYVLHGSDDYLRRHHRRKIVQHLLGGAEPELALIDLDDSAQLSDVLDELRTVPVLAPRRVVVLHDADKFITRHRAAVEGYLADPADRGSLVLIVATWRKDTRLAKQAARVGEVIDCAPPRAAGLPRWVSRVAESRGRHVAPNAVALLVAWVGPDLARLESEIEKLALYVGARREITAQDVTAVVAAAAGPVAFALTNAIEARDAPGALGALDDLLAGPGQEYRVLGMLAWHLRASQSPKARRWPPRRRPGANSPPAAVAKDFRALLAADLAIKTGAEANTTMQLLVTGLCHSLTPSR